MSALSKLATRVTMTLGIGRQTADTNESGGTARVQIALAGGELVEGAPHLQLFGFSSRPTAGADHITASQAGDRSRTLSLASGHQTLRPKNLQPGDVAIWDSRGSVIRLMPDGSIAITPQNGKVLITGALTVTGDVTANGISLDDHVHGGVETGNGFTGTPQG